MEEDNLKKSFIVRGQLRQPDGSSLSGVKVRAYHKELRREKLLGEAVTDDNGCYEIKPAVASADLILRAIGPKGEELAASDVRFHSGQEETIDLRASRILRRSPSEFERLSEDIKPHLKDIKVKGITRPSLVHKLSDLKNDEIEILAGKAGGERLKIEQMASAAKMQLKAKDMGTDLPVEVFYALSRKGITLDDPQSLLRQRTPALRRALESSIDDNILTGGDKDKLDSIVGSIRSLAVREALRLPDDPKKINAGALFNGSRLSQSAQEKIISLAFDHEGMKEEFWNRVAESPEFEDEDQLEEARFTLQLAALTAYHLPLVRAVQDIRQKKNLSSMRDFARWDEDDWLKLVKITGVPDAVPGESRESKEKAYAKALQREVELAFPTDAIKAQIIRKEPKLWKKIKPIFDVRPDFNILTDSLNLLANHDLPKPALEEAKVLQRLARVTSHYESIKALKDSGITSAHQMGSMSEAANSARFSECLGGEGADRAVYRKAYSRSCLASHLRYWFGGESIRINPSVIPSMWDDTLPDAPPAPEDAPVMATNWSDYFGPSDVCECHHDSSVLGPAAYLVDLLQFLDKETIDGKGLSMLLAPDRRPDIQHITLDINNTETPLPYIDLVNEILEQAVAHQGSLSARQTTWKKEELAANPEHVLRESYTKVLSRAIYPWNLPFDLDAEETRLYLKHLGTSRHVLMETFYSELKKDPLLDESIAAEYLNLTSREWRLISGSSSYKPWEFWGLKEKGNKIEVNGVLNNDSEWLDVLSHPSHLIDRAGITFEDLKDLLLTNFVNRNGKLNIKYENCKLADAKITGLAEDPDAAMRLCFFVRLWRSLGWEKQELDMALKVFRKTAEKTPLLSLSHLQRLKDQLEMPLIDIITFYVDLDKLPAPESGTSGPHLLESVFLNKKIIRPGDDSSFEEALIGGGGDKSITEYLPQVTAALSMRADDILMLLNPAASRYSSKPGSIVTKLSCENLSRLYRISRLCRAAQLKISEYITLIELTGIDPMVLNPNKKDEAVRRTLAFLDELDYVRNSEFSILELHALLCKGSLDGSANISLRQNTQTLQQLREGIKLIASDQSLPNSITEDDLRERKRSFIKQQLCQLLQLDATIAEKLLEGWINVVESQVEAIQAFLNPEIEDDKIIEELNLPATSTLIQENYSDLQRIDDKLPYHQAYQTLNLLKKVALVLRRFGISYAEARYLFGEAPRGWLDLSSLPLKESSNASPLYSGWKRLADVCQLRDRLGMAEPSLFDLFDIARQHKDKKIDLNKLEDDNLEDNPFIKALLERTGWDSSDFGVLIKRFNYGADDFQDERALLRIEKCFKISRRLGVTIGKPWQMVKWADRKDPGKDVAFSIKRAARARYDDDQRWSEVAAPMQNLLREKKRAALTGFLTAAWDWKPEQLYSHFLIDTEMSSCMMTSRIVQAISSVQLFVQRIFLGIEFYDEAKNLKIQFYDSASASKQWAWMKNYRVWEANRKVFLFPENWIEPELREDKSPFFKDLENELRQSEISSESAERAYLNYLQKLDDVSNLEISGYYNEYLRCYRNSEGLYEVNERLHIFGRCRTSPQAYYYRYRDEYHEWGAWEKINLDIESDYIIPIVWNRRLYLFWPIFKEIADKPTLGSENKTSSSRYWTIQLAYSYRSQGGWTPKKVSKEAITPIILLETNYMYYRRPMVYNYFSFSKILVFEQTENGLMAGESFVESNPETCRVPMNNKNLFAFEAIATAGDLYVNVFYPYTLCYAIAGIPSQKDATVLNMNPYPMPLVASFGLKPNNKISYLSNKNEIPYLYIFDWNKIPEKAEENEILEELLRKMYNINSIDKIEKTNDNYDIKLYAGNRNIDLSIVSKSDSRANIALRIDGNHIDNFDAKYVYSSTVYYKSDTHQSPPQLFVYPIKYHKSFIQSDDACLKDNAIFGKGSPEFSIPGTDISDYKLWDSKASNYRLYFPVDQENKVEILKRQEFFYEDDNTSLFVYPYQTVNTFYHPFISDFIGALNAKGIDGMLKPVKGSPFFRQQIVNPIFGHSGFLDNPNTRFKKTEVGPFDPIKEKSRPREEISFSFGQPYSLYNWELFFHIPLLIANRLYVNQRFEEAMRWFHYIFDPLDFSSADEEKWQHPWQVQPFYEISKTDLLKMSIEEMMQRFAGDEGDDTLRNQIERWRRDAFKPHLLARLRITPYMKAVVMKYLDNLFAWADQLFRRYTIESINEATQLYILAAEILGPRPQLLPAREHTDYDYASLKPHLDEFSNLLEDEIPESPSYSILNVGTMAGNILNPGEYGLQSDVIQSMFAGTVPYKTSSYAPAGPISYQNFETREYLGKRLGGLEFLDSVFTGADEVDEPLPALNLPPAGLYFCIPQNDKLLGYWDTLSDRLFKIRHCMNIEGQFRELPLFQPPIDPGMLVKAVASGVDFSTILNDLDMPIPKYRFTVLTQKATELCQEVKALGSSILAALEKKDAEGLALLRSEHEIQMLDLIRDVRKQQIKENEEMKESLNRSRDLIETKVAFYESLLAVDNNLGLNEFETSEITELSNALGFDYIAAGYHLSASNKSTFPNISVGIGWNKGLSPGGNPPAPSPKWENSYNVSTQTGEILDVDHDNSLAGYNKDQSSIHQITGQIISRIAYFKRRLEEWTHELNLAEKELKQIDKQIAAAEVRVQIAELELYNHEKQIENAKSVDEYMRSKYTNLELYDWMIGQISAVYFQSYQLAFDTAKRVEKAYQFELGREDVAFINFGYWDGLKKGLLAGEKLMNDLKRMEVAYLEQNERFFEITKNISLVLHSPMALIQLKETGICEFSLYEALFDADYPGHYMRRIKSVSLTIPCVTGPYTSINCTLELKTNTIRFKNDAGNSYTETDDDARFIHHFRPSKSTIATSHAQNDSGMFELNFRDERYLPFEGAGAISDWEIKMDKGCNAFDFNTISDVIIKLSYTSLDGGEELRKASKINLEQSTVPSPRLFSMKHEFPNEWHKFLTTQTLEFKLEQERFPFQLRGKDITIDGMNLFLLIKDDVNKKDLKDKTVNITLITLNPPLREFDLNPNDDGSVFTSDKIEIVPENLSDTFWKITTTDAIVNGKIIEDLVILFYYSSQERK
jgi:hypothetical protein